jgi:hypothetical protein
VKHLALSVEASVQRVAKLVREHTRDTIRGAGDRHSHPLCPLARSALTRYLDDGRIEIDNNSAVRTLRTVCLGRKNFLFAGFDDDGELAAAIYTLTGLAKLSGLNPELYLRDIRERIADHPITRIGELH